MELEKATAELAAVEGAAEQSAAETGQLQATLAHVRAELGLAVAERDKLQALVREDHELAEYVEAKCERERAETELKEAQVRLHGLAEKVEALISERDSLKKERTELQLKVAALRDAHEDTQLEQDNEVLRRMVERLNEQLKESQPDKRKKGSGGGMMKTVLDRYMVGEAEGQ